MFHQFCLPVSVGISLPVRVVFRRLATTPSPCHCRRFRRLRIRLPALLRRLLQLRLPELPFRPFLVRLCRPLRTRCCLYLAPEKAKPQVAARQRSAMLHSERWP